jgi:phytoene dehydrogenase-like protein
VRELIVHYEIMVPPDLESLVGLPGGNIFHGNLDLDQIFVQRPAPKYADYRSPIRGVYQCGAPPTQAGGSWASPGTTLRARCYATGAGYFECARI